MGDATGSAIGCCGGVATGSGCGGAVFLVSGRTGFCCSGSTGASSRNSSRKKRAALLGCFPFEIARGFFSAAPVNSATDSRGCRFFKYLVRCSATCGGSSSENHSGIGSGAAVSIEISCGFTGMTVLLVLAVVQQLFPLLAFPDTAEPALTFPFLCLLAVNRPAFFPPLSSAGALPL